MDFSVKEPEISSGSLNVVVAASDLLDAARASNMQPEPALGDCPTVEVVIDGDSVGGEMVPDVGEVVCPSESFASADDGDDADEASKYGDSSCPSEEPYYFAKEASKSSSKKYGSEVSRHDIAFVRGAPRLMSLWKGELHLVFGIGGHLRTVVDLHRVWKCNETTVSGWLQVSDPARPDVPLWIEFTAVHGKEKVEAGTALQRPNAVDFHVQQQPCWRRRKHSVFLDRGWTPEWFLNFRSYCVPRYGRQPSSWDGVVF